MTDETSTINVGEHAQLISDSLKYKKLLEEFSRIFSDRRGDINYDNVDGLIQIFGEQKTHAADMDNWGYEAAMHHAQTVMREFKELNTLIKEVIKSDPVAGL